MSDEFAKELADGMANLMREIAGSGSMPNHEEKGQDAEANPEINEEQRRALKAAWEAMLIEGLGEPGDEDKSKDKDGGRFQETIKKAMDKLKESEDNVRVRGASCLSRWTHEANQLELNIQTRFWGI